MTQIESAILELELVGASNDEGERARAALSARLATLGARVPVAVQRDHRLLRLRVQLAGARAADMAFHLENMVSFTRHN